jgi:hypothetical protein
VEVTDAQYDQKNAATILMSLVLEQAVEAQLDTLTTAWGTIPARQKQLSV